MPSPLAELLGALAHVFDRLSLRWYLFGAQAAIVHGAARLTGDVDATVDIVLAGPGLEELFLDRAQEHLVEGVAIPVACAEDIVLEEYHVDSITGGTDALVEVRVKLSKEGKSITASGARTDIIMASVEAVMNGMNRLIRVE